VVQSLRQALGMVRQRLGDSILMGVMVFGVGLVWTLLTIPVILAIVVVAALAGGLPALLIGSISAIFTQGAIPWLAGGLVGLPIFLMIVIVPALLIGGWQKIYVSSVWTLAYREMTALGKLAAPELPAGKPETSPEVAS
jgi:hypothetical protein